MCAAGVVSWYALFHYNYCLCTTAECVVYIVVLIGSCVGILSISSLFLTAQLRRR